MPMYAIDEPKQMSPEERFTEIAFILAKGYLRYKQRENQQIFSTQNETAENSQNQLDSPANQSVHDAKREQKRRVER